MSGFGRVEHQHARPLLARGRSAADRPGVAWGEECPGTDCIALLQEDAEQLRDTLRTAGRLCAAAQFRNFVILCFAQILPLERHCLSHGLEAVVARLLRFTVLQASNLFDCFVQVLCVVKTVVDNPSIRRVRLRACFIRLPCVDTDCFYVALLLPGQRSPHGIGQFHCAIRSHIQSARLIHVWHHGDLF